MSDLIIETRGKAGLFTLNRPAALNALTHQMCLDIEAQLDLWEEDASVEIIVFQGAGERAFCAGGDIAEMYATGSAGDFAYGRQFWTDEYRLNAKLATCPKPTVSFLQGFTMGGGVGVGCHLSCRIVGETSQIAMPEVGIGLVPDVGGSLILSKAPGRLGEYLGLTAARMGPGDAILAGFADAYLPQADWPAALAHICATGTPPSQFPDAPAAALAESQDDINRHFGGETLGDILRSLRQEETDFTADALKRLGRNAPLAMASAVQMIHRLRGSDDIVAALDLEYRFTARAMEHGDFLEGIRAAIIDKDKSPKWRHDLDKVPAVDVSKMLMPLGKDKLDLSQPGASDSGGQQMTIAFIGLGNMGAPMAANLIAAGHAVTGFDLAATPDMPMANSAAHAAEGADVVITMLPNGAILRAVAQEVIPAMKSGAVLLDCSTVDVESARAVAAMAESAGLGALDAPVSGGIGGASAGTLTFMVGGSDSAFATAKPLFDIMGQKAVHCGPAGNGQAAKICNNMILGATMIATCEAFALADKLGLERQSMFDVVSTSSGYSWSMNAYCPAPGVGPQSPSDNGYQPGFAAELMLKDLRLSQQAAQSVDADTPMGAAAEALYAQFVESEDGLGRDFSAMLERFEKRGRSEG